jgi:hypothetical protein
MPTSIHLDGETARYLSAFSIVAQNRLHHYERGRARQPVTQLSLF